MTQNRGNLEERVRNIKGSVAILDDNEADRRLFERYLKNFGKPDNLNLEFVSSNNPDYIVEAATRDTSINVALIDIFLPETPHEMKSVFENGLDAAQAIKKVRGDSIDVVLMSGIGSMTEENRRIIKSLLGERYIESLTKNSRYVDASWAKSGNPEDIKKLYGIIYSAVSELALPNYPRLYILGGPSASGKNEIAAYLTRQLNFLVPIPLGTTRPPSRPSDKTKDSNEPDLFRPLGNSFWSPEEMHKEIMSAGNPLVWTEEGGILDKEAYLTSITDDILLKQNRYMVDLDRIKKTLITRNDGLGTIRVLEVMEELQSRFKKRSQVIILNAEPETRHERMLLEGRPLSEIKARMTIEEGLDGEYRKVGDIIIDTELNQPPKDAIHHLRNRVAGIIRFTRNIPYNRPAPPAYFNAVESSLCELAGVPTNGKGAVELQEGQEIKIQSHVREAYYRSLPPGVPFFDLLERASLLRVTRVTNSEGIKSVYSTVEGKRGDSEVEQPLYDVSKGLIAFNLKNAGFEAAATDKIHPIRGGSLLQGKKFLVYGITDEGKPDASPYKLQLFFGSPPDKAS